MKKKIIRFFIVFLFIASFFHYYQTHMKQEPMLRDIYMTVRFEYCEDEDTFKFGTAQWDMLSLIDGYKDKRCTKTNQTFDDPYIYKLILGYNLEETDMEYTTEVLFKKNSMTVNGVEYIPPTDQTHINMLDAIKAQYERDGFQVYKK